MRAANALLKVPCAQGVLGKGSQVSALLLGRVADKQTVLASISKEPVSQIEVRGPGHAHDHCQHGHSHGHGHGHNQSADEQSSSKKQKQDVATTPAAATTKATSSSATAFTIKVAVLTVSDRVSQGAAEDRSGVRMKRREQKRRYY